MTLQKKCYCCEKPLVMAWEEFTGMCWKCNMKVDTELRIERIV